MKVSDLQAELGLHLHDPEHAELSTSQLLMFIQSAARDARSSGWLLRYADNASLVIADNDFEYDVPAGFAYVYKLIQEDTHNGVSVYDENNPIPRHLWSIRLNGGKPVFVFDSLVGLDTGKRIKVIGQRRPTIYTSPNELIDAGMESFIRERALYFSFRYLGAGLSELARWRQQMSQQSWVSSEAFLRRHPQEFRVWPGSEEVLGRA